MDLEPIRLVILEGDIARISFASPPNPTTIRAAMRLLAERNAPARRLWDLSGGWDSSPEEIRQLASFANREFQRSITAAIVAPKDLSYGLARVFVAWRQQQLPQLRVFRSEQRALAWLTAQPT